MDRGVAGRLGRGRQKLPETRLHVSPFSLCPKSSKVMSSGRVSHLSVPPPGTWKISGICTGLGRGRWGGGEPPVLGFNPNSPTFYLCNLGQGLCCVGLSLLTWKRS